MDASRQLVEHAGGEWDASLNCYQRAGRTFATQQIDEWVYVVGPDASNVARYSLSEWLGDRAQPDPPFIQADDAGEAWELLRVLRTDCFVWQCGACDSWLFTSNRPRIGSLRCSSCGELGVDFRHADRHVGGDED